MEKKVFDNFFLSPALDTYMCNVNKSAKKTKKRESMYCFRDYNVYRNLSDLMC